MKTIIITILFSLLLPILGGEREDLLKSFKKERIEADRLFQDAMTTIAITGAAGNLWKVSENQYFQALDYILRHTNDSSKRLKLLKNAHSLSREVQRIFDTPRDGRGSGIGMHIYHSISILYQQRTAILMLDAAQKKLWNKIADTKLLIAKQWVQLKSGKAEFSTEMHNQKVTLEIVVFPENLFRFRNRNFAVIRTDIPFAGNDDFSTVYLFELKNGNLFPHTKCKFPLISKWELQKDCLIFHHNDQRQQVNLQ